jgi:MFS family permease
MSTYTVYNGYFLFLGVAVFSALIGSVASERVNRRKFLFGWVIVGLLANIAMIFTQEFGSVYFLFISAVLGVSIGLGFPSCLAFIADSTSVEDRARTSGIIVLVTLMLVVFSFGVASFLNYGAEFFILLAAIRGLSLFTFILGDCERPKTEKIRTWANVLTSKDFFLYLFPWLMFSFTGSLMNLVFQGLPDAIYGSAWTIGLELHFLLWAVFGLLSGIMADRIGRKQPIVIGLVLLGVSFAIFGLYTSPETVIIYQAFSGVAWGFLFTVYISVLGDLAFYGSKEKFFALGAIMPLILTLGFSTLTGLFNVSISGGVLSPILSIILFLSILPVLRASETLPRKKLEAKKMKEHLEKISKLIEESKASH